VATIPSLSHETSLSLFALIAVAGPIVLIARFKVNPILSIVLAALFIGLSSGMEFSAIMKRFTEGVGSMLASIAMILGLGSMFGKLMAESGGAERIALTLLQWFGESRIHRAILATAVDFAFPKGYAFRRGVDFIGHPIVASLIAVFFSFYSLGYKCGFDQQQILGFTNDCLAPIGGVIPVIGAGGGFKEVLVGIGAAIAERASHWHLSPLFLAGRRCVDSNRDRLDQRGNYNELFGWICHSDFAETRIEASMDDIAKFGESVSDSFFTGHLIRDA